MRLPINTDQLNIIATGDPTLVKVFGTDETKTDANGKPLFRLPVLLMGTNERTDPTATITLTGPLPSIPRGPIRLKNLTISTWAMRGSDGKERNGITLRADGVEAAKN